MYAVALFWCHDYRWSNEKLPKIGHKATQWPTNKWLLNEIALLKQPKHEKLGLICWIEGNENVTSRSAVNNNFLTEVTVLTALAWCIVFELLVFYSSILNQFWRTVCLPKYKIISYSVTVNKWSCLLWRRGKNKLKTTVSNNIRQLNISIGNETIFFKTKVVSIWPVKSPKRCLLWKKKTNILFRSEKIV